MMTYVGLNTISKEYLSVYLSIDRKKDRLVWFGTSTIVVYLCQIHFLYK